MNDGNNRLLYISGAITGATPSEMQMFQTASDEFVLRGFRTFIPSEIPGAVKDQDKWTFALCRDVRVITHCYGVVALPTWERSKGALLEIFTALSLRKELVLMRGQDDAFREKVLERIRWTQAALWQSVDRSRFAHHSDIPTG